MVNFGDWIIENGINQIACFLEIWMILLCIHGVFKEKFRFTLVNIILISIDLVIMALIYKDLLGGLAVCLIYLLLFAYCVSRFKRKFKETIGRFLLGFFLIVLIELLASIIVIPITHVMQVDESLMLLINAIGLVITVVLLKLLQRRNIKVHLDMDKETWITLIVLCGLSFLFIVVDYRHRGEADQVYYFVFLVLCIITCASTLTVQKTRHELEKRKLELEMQEIYGATYKELIAEVRRKQHDFKNQLAAIYSMHLTANSLEDLVDKQRHYGDILLEECRYDRILVGCNNPILAGYLYYRCVAYEKNNVQVDYEVHVDNAECCLSLHEVIEVLGILLTNAFESYCAESKEKYIDIVLRESADNLIIEVSNVSEELTSSEIENIFREGYSSKGKNRGIGLARVKELVAKVHADIIVGNRLKETQNWVCFKLVIPK